MTTAAGCPATGLDVHRVGTVLDDSGRFTCADCNGTFDKADPTSATELVVKTELELELEHIKATLDGERRHVADLEAAHEVAQERAQADETDEASKSLADHLSTELARRRKTIDDLDDRIITLTRELEENATS